MCGELLSRKVVKIRKRRQCEGCYKISLIGTQMERNVVIDNGIEIYYLCLCCREFFNNDPDVDYVLSIDGCVYYPLTDFEGYEEFASNYWNNHRSL